MFPFCFRFIIKTVFVTSTDNGDLKTEGGGATGLEGADNICNLRAQEAALAGTYTAWLSDTLTDAKDRITQSVIPYLRTDDVRIADDFADLTACAPNCLQAPLRVDETGAPGRDDPVWTATDPLGASIGPGNCADWTVGPAPPDIGGTGLDTRTDATWTADMTNFPCGARGGLYCFQD